MLEANINLQPILAGARRLAREIGVNVQDLCEDQMRLACQDAIKKTAPFDGQTKNLSKHQKLGKEAVQKDLNKMFAPIKTEGMLWQWRNQLDEAGHDVYKTLKNGKKQLRGSKIIQNASMAQIKHLHNKHRTRRGRVKFNTNEEQVFGGRYMVPKKELIAYMKAEQKKVGQLKAGWVPAGEKFAKHHRFISKAWVTKQANRMGAGGGRIDQQGNGAIIAQNNVPYAGIRISSSTLQNVASVREKDMQKWAKKRLDKVAEKFNRDRMAA